jgi:hypothetical protein
MIRNPVSCSFPCQKSMDQLGLNDNELAITGGPADVKTT